MGIVQAQASLPVGETVAGEDLVPAADACADAGEIGGDEPPLGGDCRELRGRDRHALGGGLALATRARAWRFEDGRLDGVGPGRLAG